MPPTGSAASQSLSNKLQAGGAGFRPRLSAMMRSTTGALPVLPHLSSDALGRSAEMVGGLLIAAEK